MRGFLGGLMRRRRLLVVSGVLLLLCLAATGLLLRKGLAGRASSAALPATPLAALSLTAPEQTAAGEPFTVTVYASPPISGVEILLTAQATSGLYAQSEFLQDGAAAFVLPPGWTQSAGAATLRVRGGEVTASRAVTITPLAAANPLFTLTGPASAAIDGGEKPMLVALPLDELGNPVESGAAVVVRSQPPTAGVGRLPTEMMRVFTRDLLAAVRMSTHTVAGILTAGAGSGGAHSPTQSVRITPAGVQTVIVHATPSTAPAAGATRVRLMTEPLADAYGNLLPDGVAVFFVAASSDGSRRWLPAVTVSGRAGVTLETPAAAGTLLVQALVGQAASAPITITFTAPAPLQIFDLSVTEEEGGVTLRAGPLLTDLGALAPDGAPVTFVLTGPEGQRSTREALTQYGFAAATVYAGSLPPGVYHAAAIVRGQAEAGAAATFTLPEAAP